MTKKKKKKVSKRKPGPGKLKRFINDERVKLATGIFFILFALYLLMALISYLFTWQADQSFEFQKVLSSQNIRVENWAGKTGAFFGHTLIHKWFGVSSFFIPALLLLIGFHAIGIKLLALGKSFRICLIGLILLSVTLGYVAGEEANFLGSGPGGNHGLVVSQWLISLLGLTGAGLLIIFVNFAFVLFSYKPAVNWFKKIGGKEQEGEAANSEAIDDFEFQTNTSETDTSIINSTDIENDNKDPHLDFSTKTLIKKNQENQGNGIELTVEQKQTEEELSELKPLQLENYDPTLDLSGYQAPTIDLLEDHHSGESMVSKEELISNKNKIVETLDNYKISIKKIKATIGPTITLYEIIPAPGIRISKIKNLEDDIALSLSALGIRIIAPIPGKGTIGIEVPNQKADIVSMKSMISSLKFQESDFELPIALGKTISNESYVLDLTKMPHMLIAGATGQGKSVGLNVIITSLLYKKHPAELKFIFIDPKKVELTLYSKIERHFLAKLPDIDEAIITDTQKVINTLNSLTIEMDARYDLLKKAHVRNIKEYNEKFIKRNLNPEKGHKYMPYIVLVIDEFADLIMTAGREIEAPLARIAQIARAIGIHLVIATQRPTTNIITGVIKANFPARIAFRVTSMVDSRTILDTPGANQLVGRGDMLISAGSDLTRLQCAFIDTAELDLITEFIGSQKGYPTAFLLPEYSGEDSMDTTEIDPKQRDSLFEEAAHVVVLHQQGSTSLIQRKLSIGYNRAGRIIDQLEAANIVGPFEGSKARKVFLVDEYALEQYLKDLDKEQDNK
ncbi:MAG: DNA translocase FtsK 4TM domain-containing protein [Bacteroidota bacterium]|nr:DNA translocase FtsK 4TM domain-containing protein [Bacteroidota bacterium]